MKNKILIPLILIAIGLNSCKQKTTSSKIVAESKIEKVTRDNGYTALKEFKKNIRFGSSKAKFKLEFKDFHPDTISYSNTDYFFNEKGTVTALSLDEGFIDIKDENGEIKYLRAFPDNDSTLSLIKKNLKVGDKVNTICTPQGARLIEILEIEIY